MKKFGPTGLTDAGISGGMKVVRMHYLTLGVRLSYLPSMATRSTR